MHMNYFSSTVDYNADDLDNVCPDILEGLFAGPVTYGAGELDPYMENYYNERSHIDKAFQNWKGSVYWIQGMQDWNVDPTKYSVVLTEILGINDMKKPVLM